MPSPLTAAAIMTTRVHTVRPTDSLAKVVALLCRHRISGVPVVREKGLLAGLISERDVLEAMYPDHPELRQRRPRLRLVGGIRAIDSIRVREIMVREVVTASPDAEVLQLASLMAVRKIRRIPIVEDGRLVGIVSQGDVYRAIFAQGRRASDARALPPSPSPAPRSAGAAPGRAGRRADREGGA